MGRKADEKPTADLQFPHGSLDPVGRKEVTRRRRRRNQPLLTRRAAVAVHAQPVAALGVAHAEPVVDGVGHVPLVPQVHPQLVLPLGGDLVQVLQACVSGKECLPLEASNKDYNLHSLPLIPTLSQKLVVLFPGS